MRQRLIDWLIIGSKIAEWLFACTVIYWLVLKLTGHSPTIEEIILMFCGMIFTLVLGIAGILIKFMVDVNRFMVRAEDHRRECDRRFYSLAKDYKHHFNEYH